MKGRHDRKVDSSEQIVSPDRRRNGNLLPGGIEVPDLDQNAEIEVPVIKAENVPNAIVVVACLVAQGFTGPTSGAGAQEITELDVEQLGVDRGHH